ncbi:hypothetical protein EYF80_048468 [Liparis tanakae]|uniref:Uncharacterized protein n=1 Tax=Liparis tanakae TaxID=230148 RepID=A0A4Z2FJQ0_9TELE|nr:hypothetical protein EYF80_048468 [Liparis tanakae]
MLLLSGFTERAVEQALWSRPSGAGPLEPALWSRPSGAGPLEPAEDKNESNSICSAFNSITSDPSLSFPPSLLPSSIHPSTSTRRTHVESPQRAAELPELQLRETCEGPALPSGAVTEAVTSARPVWRRAVKMLLDRP